MAIWTPIWMAIWMVVCCDAEQPAGNGPSTRKTWQMAWRMAWHPIYHAMGLWLRQTPTTPQARYPAPWTARSKHVCRRYSCHSPFSLEAATGSFETAIGPMFPKVGKPGSSGGFPGSRPKGGKVPGKPWGEWRAAWPSLRYGRRGNIITPCKITTYTLAIKVARGILGAVSDLVCDIIMIH